MNTGFGLAQIGQIAINVHDLNRAVTFYRDVLGVKFLFQVPGMAFFDCGGVRLMLTIPEEARFDHPSTPVYYRVGDINRAFGLLSEAGVHFAGEPHLIAHMPDHELWMAFFDDTESNTLALMSEVPFK
jgi:methylmalonyl-CoA/ethylmalonyl-CoA epimerase